MKKIFFLLSIAACFLQPSARGDAATEERINQLNGKIEDLIAGQDLQRKRIEELARQVESLKSDANKPSPNYASEEDVKRLGEAVKEVDRKRMDDYSKIHDEIVKLGRTVANSAALPPSSHRTKPAPAPSTGDEGSSTAPAPDAKGYEYVVKQGDTLSLIVAAYREQNIKVTVDQILKANPGLKPERLSPGKKIFIPAPAK